MRSDVFVKVNFKTIGELKSTIIDKGNYIGNNETKYMMCAGKHTKEGWSLVFKANSIQEAEAILESNKFGKNNEVEQYNDEINYIEEKVSLPSWV